MLDDCHAHVKDLIRLACNMSAHAACSALHVKAFEVQCRAACNVSSTTTAVTEGAESDSYMPVMPHGFHCTIERSVIVANAAFAQSTRSACNALNETCTALWWLLCTTRHAISIAPEACGGSSAWRGRHFSADSSATTPPANRVPQQESRGLPAAIVHNGRSSTCYRGEAAISPTCA